jgi:glycerol-3-phosphate acyltransferase PlsY
MLAMLTYLVLTYLAGAVPFGIVITTFHPNDVDVRAVGSGNIGATNVARIFGWRTAFWVLLLDLLKGLLPVLGALLMWPEMGRPFAGLVAVTAFAAHCWPVYLEFRGGKGVATASGALLALSPLPTALSAVVWALILAATRRASYAALGAALAILGFSTWFDPRVIPLVALLAVAVAIRQATSASRWMREAEAEAARPVRWGRRAAAPATAAEVLEQDPSGGGRGTAPWREAPTQTEL